MKRQCPLHQGAALGGHALDMAAELNFFRQQGVARGAADWRPLQARAEVGFFAAAFADQDDAAAKLADFDIVLSMRERTPLPASLINRLGKLRMLGITGARNLSCDTPACTARGIPVCYTQGGANADSATAELALGLLISAARGLDTMQTWGVICSSSVAANCVQSAVTPPTTLGVLWTL